MDRYRRARLADWADSLRFLWRMLPEPEEIEEIIFNCPATPVFDVPRYDDPTIEITFADIEGTGAIFTAAGKVVDVEDLEQAVTAELEGLRVNISPEVAQLLEARHGTWAAHVRRVEENEASFNWSVYESDEDFQRLDSPPITETRVQQLFGEHPPTERGVTWRRETSGTIGRGVYPRNELPIPSPEDPDIIIRDEGSVFLVKPVSDAGRQWIDTNLQTEPWQWLGEALGVEHRFITDIIDGMLGDGLIVHFDEPNP